MLLVGAGFNQLLRSSGAEARAATNATRIDEVSARVGHIERTLAEGGPAPLALRISRVEQALNDMSDKIDKLYRTLVLRQELD